MRSQAARQSSYVLMFLTVSMDSFVRDDDDGSYPLTIPANIRYLLVFCGALIEVLYMHSLR